MTSYANVSRLATQLSDEQKAELISSLSQQIKLPVFAIAQETGERQMLNYFIEHVYPAMKKIRVAGLEIIATYNRIAECAMSPDIKISLRKKRLEQLAKRLGSAQIGWNHAYVETNNRPDDMPPNETGMVQFTSEVQDAITDYIKTGKLARLRSFFRRFPIESDFITLIDEYATRKTEWTPAREWIATELEALKRSKKKGSYKVLSTLYLLPRLVDTKTELFAGDRKLTAEDRKIALSIIDTDTTSNLYFVRLVSDWGKRKK